MKPKTRNSKKLIYGKEVKGHRVARINGKVTKTYSVWYHMLRRCYDPKALSRNPTYSECSVSNEWLFFPTFRKWFDSHYIEGWELDKDLLVAGNKEYGPETCVFVPQCINTLFTDHGRARGEYPIGVTFHKQSSKFRARLSIDGTQKCLGYFNSIADASQAYQLAKKEKIIRTANEWKNKISDKLYTALLTKAENMLVE